MSKKRNDAQVQDYTEAQRANDGTIPQAYDGTIAQVEDGTIPQQDDGTIPQAADGTIPQSSATLPGSIDGTGDAQAMKNVVQVASMAAGAAYLDPGRVIDLGGEKCTVVSKFDANSGEAHVYLVRRGGEELVFKHYKSGIKPKTEVLDRLAKGRHAHVIRVERYGQFEGRYYELMEYARGGSMNDLLASGGFRDVARLRLYVAQIADGLRSLHGDLRVVYQDLKPRNILFRDASRTELVLADFGISSILPNGASEMNLSLTGTPVYAAPELSIGLGEKSAKGGFPVDYFAFGITLWHLWIGALPERKRNRPIALPSDMDQGLARLIRGLTFDQSEKRFTDAEADAWARGESFALPEEKDRSRVDYVRYSFANGQAFSTPKELADLMEADPERGKDYLFMGPIKKWVEESNDVELGLDIAKLLEDDRFKSNRAAALDKALYILDKERVFVSAKGTKCSTLREIGLEMESDADYYRTRVADPLNPVFTYVEAVYGKANADGLRAIDDKNAEARFQKIVLLLQANGGDGIRILESDFDSLESLAACADGKVQDEVRRQLKQTDSKVQIWLQVLGYIEDRGDEARDNDWIDADEWFGILAALPWLDYRRLFKGWQDRQYRDACRLVELKRGDLLERFRDMKLSFNGICQSGRYKDCTPITFAATAKLPDMVRKLIELGASKTQRDTRNNNALYIAVLARDTSLVKLLLDLKFPTRDDELFQTPLMLALRRYSDDTDELYAEALKCARLLLDRDANVFPKDDDGWSALHFLCRFASVSRDDCVAILKAILERGVEANEATKQGITPLYMLMKNDKISFRVPFCELLLPRGADPNAKEPNTGETPLMVAAAGGLKDVVALLLKNGASKTIVDKSGLTAYHHAAKAGRPETARMLNPGKALKAARFLSGLSFAATIAFALSFLAFSVPLTAPALMALRLGAVGTAIAAYAISLALVSWCYFTMSGSPKEYRDNFIGTVNNARGAFLYFVACPVLFPIADAALTRAIEFIPGADAVTRVLSAPASFLVARVPPALSLVALVALLAALAMPAMLVNKWNANARFKYQMYKKNL